MAGLETEVIGSLIELLARGYREDVVLAAMLQSPDPGAGLAERILSAGIEDFPLQGWLMSAPVQRHLGKRIGLRRKFPGRAPRKVEGYVFGAQIVGGRYPLLLGHAPRIEWLLCQGSRTPERWIDLARLALEHGDPDAASTWADRALAMRETLQAHWLHGMAHAELGRKNWEWGHPSATWLRMSAERSLRRAEEMLDASSPSEDVLALQALRAENLLELGREDDAEWSLRHALRRIEEPAARASDLERVARVLRRKGRADRAREILNQALSKTQDPVQRARLRLDLGLCAFAQGDFDEAESIAAALSAEKDSRIADATAEIRAGADTLRIRTRLIRNQPREALALADAALAWGSQSVWLDRNAPARMPLLAIALHRSGRARDAEIILRKLLGLPIELDVSTTALGLSSRNMVLSFLDTPLMLGMDPSMKRELWDELVQALRSQGRHVEANEMEHLRDDHSKSV